MARRVLLALAILCMPFFGGAQAIADTYGSSTYGNCIYGQGCAAPSTIIPAPSTGQNTTPRTNPDIAVNLSDGQIIPEGGYDITVTPINGQGNTFDHADIYIDGNHAATVTPGSNGTAIWHWDTNSIPGTSVKVIVTYGDGSTTSKLFAVKMNPKAAPGGPVETQRPPSNSIIAKSENFVRHLPRYAIVGFPWLLFLILAGEIIALIVQTRRELKELRITEALIAREREIASLKLGFTELLSHYLRTPFTVMKSGAESLTGPAAAAIPAGVIEGLNRTIQKLGTTIEAILTKMTTLTIETSSSTVLESATKSRTRQRVLVWLPVVCVGILGAIFVYLAQSVGRLGSGTIAVYTNMAAYLALAIGVGIMSRQLYLRRTDRKRASAALAEASALGANRDQLMTETAASLTALVTELDSYAGKIPGTVPMAKFVQRGISQMKAVQSKLAIATSLKGRRSTGPYEQTSIQTLFNQAAQYVAEAATTKKITLNCQDDAKVSIQNVGLITITLQSLLDNAVAYSPEGSAVTVQGSTDKDGMHIMVTDQGSGIPADKLDSLFQAFSKAEGAEVFTHEGMGFSLYIDKLIMTYLGGAIELTSTAQKGTQAKISMPVQAA